MLQNRNYIGGQAADHAFHYGQTGGVAAALAAAAATKFEQ